MYNRYPDISISGRVRNSRIPLNKHAENHEGRVTAVRVTTVRVTAQRFTLVVSVPRVLDELIEVYISAS